MECAWKICTNTIKPRRRFYSPQCKHKFFVDKRRKGIKQMSLDYKGGVCIVCGYNRCVGALIFHHREPDGKDFGVSAKGYTRSWEKVRIKLDKCVLLCSNCRAEVHAGQLSVERQIEKLGEIGERVVAPTPSQVSMGFSVEKGVETKE